MERRNFLKWLGITPALAFLGIKIPWPKPDVLTVEMVEEAIRKAEAKGLKPYQWKKESVAVGEIYSKGYNGVKFDPENYGVIAANSYESKRSL